MNKEHIECIMKHCGKGAKKFKKEIEDIMYQFSVIEHKLKTDKKNASVYNKQISNLFKKLTKTIMKNKTFMKCQKDKCKIGLMANDNIQTAHSCTLKHCQKEQAASSKAAAATMQKVLQTNTAITEGKISLDAGKKQIQKLSIDLLNSIESFNMLKCQIDKCYKEIEKMLMHHLHEMAKLHVKDKKNPRYILATKYQKLFKKGITPKLMQQFNVDNTTVNFTHALK